MTSPADEQQPSGPALHQALEPGFLVGTWRGLGVGGYPTIDGFRYEQEIVFSHDGRPFLSYASRSWILDDDGNRVRPARSEVGWWRLGAEPRSVEVMLAQHKRSPASSASMAWSAVRTAARRTSPTPSTWLRWASRSSRT